MKKYCLPGFLGIIFLTFFNPIYTCAQDIQLSRVSIDELKDLMDKDKEVLILDTQPEKLYQLGHIKGALSFPFKMQLDWTDVQNLSDDKLIVLYCDCGPGEADSNAMGIKLREMGFWNVKVLAAPSIRGWVQKGYPMDKYND